MLNYQRVYDACVYVSVCEHAVMPQNHLDGEKNDSPVGAGFQTQTGTMVGTHRNNK
jgi:hypothetical protein